MNISVWISIFFVLAYGIAFSEFFLVKKREEACQGMLWIVLTIVLLMGYHTLIAAMCKLVSGIFSMPLIALGDLSIGGVCWQRILKTNQKQLYYFDRLDGIVCGVLSIVVLYFTYREFTFSFHLGYITSDPGVHYGLAMNALRYGETTGMFFAEINNALFIGVFAPFLSSLIYCYKMFILADVLMFLLSGCIFYVLIKEYLRVKYQMILGVFAIVLYMIGYPLNNMLFGFIYLGMSVTVIAYIMIVLKQYMDDAYDKRLLIAMLMIGVLSLVLCYMLFAPIIWFAVFACLCWYYWKIQRLFTIQSVMLLLCVFLIPTILAFKFCFLDYFIGRDLNISNTIANEGGIYKDFFSNFIMFLPFAVYGFIEQWKTKTLEIYEIFTMIFFGFIFVMFLFMYQGYVSEYYYYKAYYPFWLMYFILVVKGLCALCLLPKSVLASMASIFIVIVGINRLNLERRMLVNHPTFTSEKSRNFMDIYIYNAENLITHEFYDQRLIDLYQYAMDECMTKSDKPIPVFVSLSNYEDWYWFESFSGMDSSMFYTWDIGENGIKSKILHYDADYVIVKYDDPMYQNNRSFFKPYQCIYKNEVGCIYQIQL